MTFSIFLFIDAQKCYKNDAKEGKKVWNYLKVLFVKNVTNYKAASGSNQLLL
ncbi:hypothetical protein HMPREF9104_02971 [Lentilactobacillus kisonensis F0435]|uniref:Uncharacterized protein n=1 Tax=Lentilactobacillus kisonensis F0435 TaxID=797516 RepID=H1LK25_9LACO|nr:hypothetical protein HMPREF9104_02971 [Lentilactobacillus kisonensis F0435]